jgi:transporter family protein
MHLPLASWQFWAILSAVFAALTALLAKVGVANVNSDLATFVRTVVILAVISLICMARGLFGAIGAISSRSLLFLILSGCATGASWLCYFRAIKMGNVSQVAPIDKLSVVMVAVLSVLFLGEKMSPVNWTGIVFVAVGVILVGIR